MLQVLYLHSSEFACEDSNFQKNLFNVLLQLKLKKFYNPDIYTVHLEIFYFASKNGRK